MKPQPITVPTFGLNHNPAEPSECFAWFKYALDAQIFADISNSNGASRCYAWDLATGERITVCDDLEAA